MSEEEKSGRNLSRVIFPEDDSMLILVGAQEVFHSPEAVTVTVSLDVGVVGDMVRVAGGMTSGVVGWLLGFNGSVSASISSPSLKPSSSVSYIFGFVLF